MQQESVASKLLLLGLEEKKSHGEKCVTSAETWQHRLRPGMMILLICFMKEA